MRRPKSSSRLKKNPGCFPPKKCFSLQWYDDYKKQVAKTKKNKQNLKRSCHHFVSQKEQKLQHEQKYSRNYGDLIEPSWYTKIPKCASLGSKSSIIAIFWPLQEKVYKKLSRFILILWKTIVNSLSYLPWPLPFHGKKIQKLLSDLLLETKNPLPNSPYLTFSNSVTSALLVSSLLWRMGDRKNPPNLKFENSLLLSILMIYDEKMVVTKI